jgi:uncharacterized protein YgiM (DUF1202 family)
MEMAHKKFYLTYFVLFILLLINSCVSPETWQSQEVYYTNPVVTYLRESPGYASQTSATLYQGEQVIILSRTNDDWCQVKTAPGGQIGWIHSTLLSSKPIPIETYYVQVQEVPLRAAPQKEIRSRLVLHRGDKVRKLSENEQGWWRVLVEKDRSLGWIPVSTISGYPSKKTLSGAAEKPSEKIIEEKPASSRPAPNQPFFVATTVLKLHRLPLISSEVVKVLTFSERVEKVSQSGSNWLKVKHPKTGVQGWTQSFYLSESPAKVPKPIPQKKERVLKTPAPPEPDKKDIIQPEEFDPEVM